MLKNTRHFLIIRPGALGDTLVTFPILQHLRTLSTQTRITVVGNAAVLPLMQAFRLADEVENFEDLLWSRLFMLPSSHHQTQLYSRLQHIDRAICWLTDTDNLVKQNLQAAGIPNITIAPGRPAVALPIVSYLAQSIGEAPETISWRVPAEYMWQSGPSGVSTQRAIAIHPGSGGSQKCWPITHFATIITELWRHNIPVLLLAGPADHERISALRKLLPIPEPATLLHLLQDAPLLTVAQKLRHCRSYLGNDAGISHLAGMLGIPTLVLFGPSDPTIWKPTGPIVVALKASSLDALTPQTVYAQLAALSTSDTA
jgi:heptosyltransferase III